MQIKLKRLRKQRIAPLKTASAFVMLKIGPVCLALVGLTAGQHFKSKFEELCGTCVSRATQSLTRNKKYFQSPSSAQKDSL